MAAPEWLPDWRDEAAYPPDTASMTRWAWEFLRRNPEYRGDFASVRHVTDPESENDEMFRHYCELCRKWRLRSWVFDPALRFDQIARYMPFDTGAPTLWAPLHDPGSDGTMPPGRVGDHEVVLRFDLTQPIGRQIEAARERLNFYAGRFERKTAGVVQPFRARAQRGKYGEYLRILDASEAGETLQTIVADLYPTSRNTPEDQQAIKATRAKLKAAIRLRDMDYWKLALMKE